MTRVLFADVADPRPGVVVLATPAAGLLARCAAARGFDVEAEGPAPGAVVAHEVADVVGAVPVHLPVAAVGTVGHAPGAVRAAVAATPGVGLLHVAADGALGAGGWIRELADTPGLGHVAQVGVHWVDEAGWRWTLDHPEITTWHDALIRWELAGGEPWRHLSQRIARTLPDRVWIVVDPGALATGAHPSGVSWAELGVLLRVVVGHGCRIAGFTVPPDDPLGPHLLHRLSAWALASRRNR